MSTENILRKCNAMVDFSKFTANKNILSEVVDLSYNQVCCQALSFKEHVNLFLVAIR